MKNDYCNKKDYEYYDEEDYEENYYDDFGDYWGVEEKPEKKVDLQLQKIITRLMVDLDLPEHKDTRQIIMDAMIKYASNRNS